LKWRWLSCQAGKPYPVPLLPGGFFAIRRELFTAIEGFDGGMLMYGMEDAELSLRLWTLGYQCVVVPEVLVAHRFGLPNPNQVCDYKFKWEVRIHNELRLAVVHFRPDRIKRVVKRFASMSMFPAAFARLTDSDAWARRREFQATRRFDDDWFFRKFEIEPEIGTSDGNHIGPEFGVFRLGERTASLI